MSGAGSHNDLVHLSNRVTAVEVRLKHVDETMSANRKATAHAIDTLRDDMKEEMQQVVHAQVQGDELLTKDIERVGKRIDTTNASLSEIGKTLSSINTKLAIHAFVFAALGAVALALFTAYSKSSFDQLNKNSHEIRQLQDKSEK